MANILPERPCNRCGIHFTITGSTRKEWRDYCKDCRHEVKVLGWIPRSRKATA